MKSSRVMVNSTDARNAAHAALDRWLDELSDNWKTVLTSRDEGAIKEASRGRPDLPAAIHKSVGEFVNAVIDEHGAADA